MLRKFLIALTIGLLLLLILPGLLAPREIDFKTYADIQTQPKIIQQSNEAQYLHALRTSSRDPIAGLDLLDEIALSGNTHAQNARQLALAIRRAAIEDESAYTFAVLGQGLAQIGQWQLSIISLEQAITASPNYAEAWAYLGEAQQQSGLDGSVALDTAIDINPLSISANLFQALFWQRQGDFSEAFRHLQIAHLLAPENTNIIIELARNALLEGNVFEARAYYEQALEIEPDKQALWKEFAHFSLDNNIFLEEIGLPAARRALVLDAADPEALLLIGLANHKSLNATSEALTLINSALQIDPTYFNAHLEIARIYLEIQDLQSAKYHLEQAILYSSSGNDMALAESLYEQYFPE